MTQLLYRPDIDEARKRLTDWWHGRDLGRPALLLTVPRSEPLLDIPEMPIPPNVRTPRFTAQSLEFRLNYALHSCNRTHYLAEAVPSVQPHVGPGALALYLGAQGIEDADTVWMQPCIDDPPNARFQLDPQNFYWKFTLDLIHSQIQHASDRFLTAFPDLIEGLDTLAALRGTETLLLDLTERPDWVHDCLEQINRCYFQCYDHLYNLIKDETGGSHFWTWAPGRVSKLQCDISAMISPAMFRDFMSPILTEMCRRLDYSLYHLDGPDAICHLDHLLAIEELDMVQWVPGSAAARLDDPQWWPMLHRITEAKKKVFLIYWQTDVDIELLKALKKEFGPQFSNFMLALQADSFEQAEKITNILQL